MQQYSFSTVGDIIDTARAEVMGSTDSSLTALQDDALIKQLERINARFVRAAHPEQDNEGWSWMRGQKEYKTISQTSLAAAITAGNGTVTVNASSAFPATGRIAIETLNNILDFVDYNANAANVFTVDTGTGKLGVTMDHDNGEEVHPMYELPSDMGKIQEVFLNGREIHYEELKLMPYWNHYTVVDQFLLLPEGLNNDDMVVQYEKKPTAFYTGDSGADRLKTTDIPTEFERYAIEMLNAYMFAKRRKREHAADAKLEAQVELDDALAYDMSLTSGTGLQAAW